VLYILPACKAEEGGDAAASLTDDFMPVGWDKFSTKFEAHLTESIFQTRSR